ncbi:hypothetical protein CLOSTMETH_00372 [[Clostridium] methylpentosum DSM 5476]|uniref:Uncharacterized protein n=1 Tax=[Clostridium] methylpentosum DSM 5476 TaxID=537013 RepID=C0E974_9FIRM|nr:hypothetical protein CLOSTMETH_00372 [[Clostridium] methylpentosum DSM 5476]
MKFHTRIYKIARKEKVKKTAPSRGPPQEIGTIQIIRSTGGFGALG